MRKNLLALAMLLVSAGAMAEELKVADVTLPQNATAEIQFELNNPNTELDAFSFSLTLPDGVVPVMTTGNTPSPSFIAGDRFVNGTGISSNLLEGNIVKFARLTDGNAITGTSGVLFSAVIKVDGELEVGTKLQATVSDIQFTTPSLTKEELDDVQFTITIAEPVDGRTVLDETSTTIPQAATGVDVRVKRTIKANEWSTICLPFAMTEAQVTEAFGSDVQLADFTSWESEEDEDGDIVGISVGFENVSEIEANHPYIIKVTSAIEEFTADGVDIEPDDEPTQQVGKKKAERGYFIGTYIAGTTVPKNNLFLSGNKFWYSTDQTKIKAFRAYFEFADVLTSVEEAETKVRFTFDGTPTAIEDITVGEFAADDAVYTLSGVRLGKAAQLKSLPQGLYIVNGKKVFVK